MNTESKDKESRKLESRSKREKEKLNSKPLMDKIREAMQKKEHSLHDLSSFLGISYIHATSLMGGARPLTGLSISKQRQLSEYLGLPFAQFYMYLGVLRVEDFFVSDSFDDQADLSFEKMRKDSMWGSFVPPKDQTDSMPKNIKLLIVLMYEKLSNETLLDKTDVIIINEKESSKD